MSQVLIQPQIITIALHDFLISKELSFSTAPSSAYPIFIMYNDFYFFVFLTITHFFLRFVVVIGHFKVNVRNLACYLQVITNKCVNVSSTSEHCCNLQVIIITNKCGNESSTSEHSWVAMATTLLLHVHILMECWPYDCY